MGRKAKENAVSTWLLIVDYGLLLFLMLNHFSLALLLKNWRH